MSRTALHLIDRHGEDVSVEISEAVQASYRWALRDYPRIDTALVANWAEDVARSMQQKSEAISSPRRYAFAAMRGNVLEWVRRGGTSEIPVGIGAARSVDRSESWSSAIN